jgi:hypothetical protein
MIKHLINEIIDLNKKKGEGKKPFNPFFKKKINMDVPPSIPPPLGINLEDSTMEKFCRTHHADHSKRTCPEFINCFTVMLLLQEPPKKDKHEERNERIILNKKRKKNLHPT